MVQNILGVIPARGGSKGIPRKNLLTLGGKTLLELAVQSARASRLLTRTIVSTEDPELADVSRTAGAEVSFIRPADLASDTASTWSVMRHAVETLLQAEGWKADIVVVLQPTTPLRRGSHIDQTIRVVLDSEAQSAITVREVDYPPHWMLRMDAERRLLRLIDDGHVYTRRQDTPKVYQPNGMVYVVRAEALANLVSLPGSDTRAVIVPVEESINIDYAWQYQLAQLIWEQRKR